MAKFKVVSLCVVLGGKKWLLGDVLDTEKMPSLKNEIESAEKAGYLKDTTEKKKVEAEVKPKK